MNYLDNEVNKMTMINYEPICSMDTPDFLSEKRISCPYELFYSTAKVSCSYENKYGCKFPRVKKKHMSLDDRNNKENQ
ncbi:hypothetical protein ACFL1H_01755 [Nanoarchaeota archaeon]